jgi:general secretion pathway protein K
MLAALWLVVAIAVVALAFALDARERRGLGIEASDRGAGRAAAAGALAMLQARLDQALRNAPRGTAVSGTRSGDPLMDIDSVYSGTTLVDSIPVTVKAIDLGSRLNINTATEDELRTFFGLVLNDYPKADQLAEMMMDWRDADDIARANGDESDGYVKKGLLALPTNQPFRDVSDLQQVEAMTPDIYGRIASMLTTLGSGGTNINTAPPMVLRAVPGMTDQIVANILSQRARGLRITSVGDVVPGAATGGGRGGRGGGANGNAAAVQANETALLGRYLYVDTRDIEVTLTARPSPAAQPTRLTALLQRGTQSVTVTWQQW